MVLTKQDYLNKINNYISKNIYISIFISLVLVLIEYGFNGVLKSLISTLIYGTIFSIIFLPFLYLGAKGMVSLDYKEEEEYTYKSLKKSYIWISLIIFLVYLMSFLLFDSLRLLEISLFGLIGILWGSLISKKLITRSSSSKNQ